MFRASKDYDPLGVLIEEHWIFRDRIRAFLEELQPAPRSQGSPTLDPQRVSSFVNFLADDVEEKHGGREEQGLFPVLARHIGSDGGPLSVFLSEHQALRAHRTTLHRVGERLGSDPEDPSAHPALLRETQGVHQLLDDHMEREDTMLFPMAREVLTVEDIAEVSEIFQRLEKELGPVQRIVEKPKSPSNPTLTPFCPAGRAKKDMAERA
ncbi:MAG: hemerythrin domain-containing protein [Euryarchaeota archaeon]|nr:hemerythrin domain-containing protein [Euryarchaeota archaeon]MDE1879821.1 hemerythrin domain-containing protein [Euryarchaeota archaeon]MDE2045262.1 hemerythrin domain-containing protein [Thermoplasmata archaeon]